MVGCGSCPPDQRWMLGDLPPGATGGGVARRHAARSASARAQHSREGGNQGAMFGLPDAAAARYQTSAAGRAGDVGMKRAV